METTFETNVTEPVTPSQETNNSADNSWESGKYPAWQKSIGKEYWGNPKLKDFSSMKDVIESIVNPKTNAPENYELGLDEAKSKEVSEVFKKADVSQDNAKAITDIFSKYIAKLPSVDSLKDLYGADYEEAESNVAKAISKVCGNNEKLMKAVSEGAVRNNPAVFEFMKIVGQNLGSEANLDMPKSEVGKKTYKDPIMEFLVKAHGM